MYLDLELLKEKYERGEYINPKYIPTPSIFSKSKMIRFQDDINFLYANLTFEELREAINNLKEFDECFNNDSLNKTETRLYNSLMYKNVFSNFDEESNKILENVENNMINYYVLNSRAMNIASDTCELYGKAILLKNGVSPKTLKHIGHDLFELYYLLNKKYKDAFSDLTTHDISVLVEMSSKRQSKKINITSRYPGEDFVKGNPTVLFKLANAFYKASILCGNKYDAELVSYEKNNNLEMNESLIEKYQSEINYLNADLMVEELSTLISNYNYEYIFTTYHRAIEDQINVYTIRSKIIKKSCDIFEHQIDAMLIEKDRGWDQLSDIGHNIGKKYHKLEKREQLSIILETLFRYDDLDERNKVVDYLLNNDEISEEIQQNLYDNFIDKDKLLNLSPRQLKPLSKNKKVSPDYINKKSLEMTMNKMFNVDILERQNVMSRYPGIYYIKQNAALISNMAFAVATESIHKRKEKIKK